MSQHISHVAELTGGPTPLVLTLSISDRATTLEMREKGIQTANVHTLTKRCSILCTTKSRRRNVVGVLLRLTEGFEHLVDGFHVLRPKHMIQGCLVLDVRNTEHQNDVFQTIVDHYKGVGTWLKPYASLVIPKEFADELRKLP